MFVQPLKSVPVTEYTVLTLGVVTNAEPVTFAGTQLYVIGFVPPDWFALSDTVFP